MKVDYSKLAYKFDNGCTQLDETLEQWVSLIKENTNISTGNKLIELGCGTGRFTIPLAYTTNFDVTAVDISNDMLNIAIKKDHLNLIKWKTCNADTLPFPNSSFNIVFMSNLLHLVEDISKVIRECSRILTKDGLILIRFEAWNQAKQDVEHTFFPESVKIDSQRFLNTENLENILDNLSFSCIKSTEVIQKSFCSSDDHLNAIQNRSTSTLSIISDDCFTKGIFALKKYINENPADKWLLYNKRMLTTGKK